MRKYSLILVVFLLGGCASAEQYVPFPKQSVSIENPALARIYVIRSTSFGSLVKIKVRDTIRDIGKTGPNSFLCWEREAKNINLVSEAENTSNLPLNLEPGHVYYIQQHIRMGLIFARNWLEVLDAKEGEAYVKKAKAPKLKDKKTNVETIS